MNGKYTIREINKIPELLKKAKDYKITFDKIRNIHL